MRRRETPQPGEIRDHLAFWLLRFYPRHWRDRYKTEMTALLEEHRVTLRTLIDLLGGALDARLTQQRRSERSNYPMYAIRSTRSLRQAQLVVFWLFPIFLVALLYRASQMIDWNEPGPIRHYFNVAEQYPALNQVAATVGVATGVALLAQFVGGTLLLWSGSRGRRAFVALSLLATYVGPVLYFSAPSLQGAIVSVVCVELAFGVLLARLLRSGASGVMREEPATRGWWGSFVATTVTVAALSVGMVAMGLWGGFLWTQGQDLEPNALVAVGVAALALIVFGWSLASFWTAPKPAPATM